MYAEVWEADLGRNICFYWDAFAETVTTLRGKSEAAFAHVFGNLFDETKDSLRQSIFMKLFDFKKLSLHVYILLLSSSAHLDDLRLVNGLK